MIALSSLLDVFFFFFFFWGFNALCFYFIFDRGMHRGSDRTELRKWIDVAQKYWESREI